jgi:hypothetical protein
MSKFMKGDKVKVVDWSYSLGLTPPRRGVDNPVCTVVKSAVRPVAVKASCSGYEIDTAITDGKGSHWFVCSKGLRMVDCAEKKRLIAEATALTERAYKMLQRADNAVKEANKL